MAQRMQDLEEAQRWKRKFLDALEDHEQREKLLTARIRLLRRGLVGVSLAGDGYDSRLDKQLSELRSSLRNDDRETGLELLFEKIEQSIVRLDVEKNASDLALQQAFTACLNELSQLQLPSGIRRQIKKFTASLPEQVKDAQQHAGLIRQFMELLRESVHVIKARELEAAAAPAGGTPGFWGRLFSTNPSSNTSSNTSTNTSTNTSANAANNTNSAGASASSAADHDQLAAKAESAAGNGQTPLVNAHTSAPQGTTSHAVLSEESAPPQPEEHVITLEAADDDDSERVLEASLTTRAHSIVDDNSLVEVVDETDEDRQERDALNLQTDTDMLEIEEVDEVTLEGELIRDRSGLAEPAFSFIAGHVEPLLLRILESIHITGESLKLAESIRRNVVKGLNWYDFVAVLEQILQVLRNAADQQRTEFQGFLNGVNESLAQVQAFMELNKRHSQEAQNTDAAMDASVREQIDGIQHAVANADDDIEALKLSVQGQIGAIIESLDGFKLQRMRQEETMAGEAHQMVERIAVLEIEARELRLNLSRQQETAFKDSLTDLPNREAYNQHLTLLLESWRPTADQEEDGGRTLCLAVADVDFFKNINDSYGHLAGDKVLKIIARELVTRLREKDFIARYGGEEFVVVMPDTRPADAEHVLNKLRLAIAAIPFHFKERQIQITLSMGVVAANVEDTVETLFDRADRALYIAKANGRNKVQRER